MTPKQRREIEKKIIAKAIDDILAANFTITVHDGEEKVLIRSTKREKILSHMFSTDMETLLVIRGGEQFGWLQLVYGNDGHDVIHDYTTNLEALLAGASQLADELAAGATP